MLRRHTPDTSPPFKTLTSWLEESLSFDLTSFSAYAKGPRHPVLLRRRSTLVRAKGCTESCASLSVRRPFCLPSNRLQQLHPRQRLPAMSQYNFSVKYKPLIQTLHCLGPGVEATDLDRIEPQATTPSPCLVTEVRKGEGLATRDYRMSASLSPVSAWSRPKWPRQDIGPCTVHERYYRHNSARRLEDPYTGWILEPTLHGTYST